MSRRISSNQLYDENKLPKKHIMVHSLSYFVHFVYAHLCPHSYKLHKFNDVYSSSDKTRFILTKPGLNQLFI